jgi:anti-anti-sigma regulatory factor
MLGNAAKLNLESLVSDRLIGRSLEQASRADIVIVDVRSLKRVNARLLEAFVRIKKAMLRSGRLGIVRLVVSSPTIRKTLAVTGLAKLFEVYETAELADAAQAKIQTAPRRPAA